MSDMTREEAEALYDRLCELIGWERVAVGGMDGPHDAEDEGGFYRMEFCVRVRPCEECLRDLRRESLWRRLVDAFVPPRPGAGVTRTRQISDEMLQAMKLAARETWKRHAAEVPAEDREEWAKLCKRHCANALAKEWGS